MSDGYGYGHVLKSVASSLPPDYFEKSTEERAKSVIDTCRAEGLNPPIEAQGIMSGNPKLNTLLLA